MSVARAEGFDPLVPQNWYKFRKISQYKGSQEILVVYKRGLSEALATAFPEIGFDRSKFSMNLIADRKKQKPRVKTNTITEPPLDWAEDMAQTDPQDVAHGEHRQSTNATEIQTEIDLDVENFIFRPRGYWEDIANRKAWFDNFARRSGFDPLNAERWYRVNRLQFLDHKSACSVFHYYHGSFIHALQDVYPYLHLDPKKFSIMPKNHWRDARNRKKFFEQIALKMGFDPYVAENWYSASPFKIIRINKTISKVTKFHQGQYEIALMQLFPNIGLERHRFTRFRLKGEKSKR